MSQNIYDDPDFHDAYRRLPRSRHGLEGAPEWHTVAELLPEVDGRDVVDLGCGFGAFARWAAEHGCLVSLCLSLTSQSTFLSHVFPIERSARGVAWVSSAGAALARCAVGRVVPSAMC